MTHAHAEIELATPPRFQPDEINRSGESSATSVRKAASDPEASTEQLALEREATSLPPMDGGKDAWLFLAATFVVEAFVWGFPYAFGVFQNHYSTHAPFAGSSNIPVIGTCAMVQVCGTMLRSWSKGIMYLDGPIAIGLLLRYPRQARWGPLVGLVLMCTSLALSSFSTTIGHLITTQGVFYAIGGSIAYCPCLIYTDQWFARRKGLAYGIMWSGTGLGGLLIPFFLEFLLNKYGFRTTLRVWASILFVAAAPLCYFIKPRLPIATSAQSRRFNLRFVSSRIFLLHQLANVIQATGFFLPGIYLPSFAQSFLGASPFLSALTIALVNVAAVFGCVAMGSLTDRLHVTTCILLCTVGATISVLIIWGLSSSLPVLYLFCIVYGLSASSFTSCWPGVVKQVVTYENRKGRGVDGTMVIGCLASGRGIGNVISGPISELLIKGQPWHGRAASAYGSSHGTLIVFTGVTALLGGTTVLWRKFGWLGGRDL
ncbi:hypothetical protein jhhlp_000895 [Lomentospora prolificans]|uniref:Major facilitator superfamily (MFS) profile domain-containing protein n=1 Tax=Lomentospora prolificans TaxID=41688 RepID=A0A2N3NJR4_9PEZI|nr:hypothetical protein jhhlp_000895 [Lomentospora prolificans]